MQQNPTVGHLIDGRIAADTRRTQPVFNPATGRATLNVALTNQATVEAVVATAEKACQSFGGWKRSLFSDLQAYGPDAARFCTKRKAITPRRRSAYLRDGAVFSFPSSH